MAYSIAELQDWAAARGGRCLSEAYIGTMSHYDWLCGACDKTWKADWNNVRNHGSWCPYCKNSFREEFVRAIFQECFPGEEFPKDRKLIGMELDGFAESQCLAFECDGIQHRIRVPHFQRNDGDFEAQLARDADKDILCGEAGITLIRVPDAKKLPDGCVREFIREQLEELAYPLPPLESLPTMDELVGRVHVARTDDKYIDRARAFVVAQGGHMLSNRCPNRTLPLMVRCQSGHEYETNFDNLERGRGCPWCARNRPLGNKVAEAVAARDYRLLAEEHRKGKDGRSRLYITVHCPDESHPPFEMHWDNFKAGKGCERCGSMRAGATKKKSLIEIQARVAQMGLRCVTEHPTLNKTASFECLECGYGFDSTIVKLENQAVRCPGCLVNSYEDLELLGNLPREATTPSNWRCRICNYEFSSAFSDLRRRKARCFRCAGKA